MNLEELRSVQRTERESSQLQHLRDSFYRDVAEYIEERKATYRREMQAADDPFAASEDLDHLKDEVEAAQDVVEALYERRVGKVVKQAAFAAAGMSTEEEGLTTEERELFDDLVERIRSNRRRVLDTLTGESGPATDASTTDPTDPTGASSPGESTPDAAGDGAPAGPDAVGGGDPASTDPPVPPADDVLSEAMGGSEDGADALDAADPADDAEVGTDSPVHGRDVDPDRDPAGAPGPDGTPSPSTTADPSAGATGDSGDVTADPGDAGAEDADRVLVRITRDVGEIYGVDQRSYDLAPEDVVTLPTANAGPLIDRDAAERLE
jgi:DNA replication factor GINS